MGTLIDIVTNEFISNMMIAAAGIVIYSVYRIIKWLYSKDEVQ